MSSYPGSHKTAFKLQQAYGRGTQVGRETRPSNMDRLVGHSNEVLIEVNNIRVKALLDTGATVSFVSESFYNDNLRHVPIQPLDFILDIEHAGGDSIPYRGFIEINVTSTGNGIEVC